MQYFIFTNPFDLRFFEYLISGHREMVKGMMDLAQTGAANSEVEPEDIDAHCTSDERVIERLAESLEEFVVSDLHQAVSSQTRFWPDMLEAMIIETDFRAIAAAVYYGVDPDSEPRARAEVHRD